MSADAIFHYFNQKYGEVRHITLDMVPPHRFAYVTFAIEESAKMASAKLHHTIAGHIVDIPIIDDYRLQNNILSLNDDCILELFEYLGLNDLTNMASMCTRLRDLAQLAFESKFKGRPVTLTFKNIKNCVQHFGSYIEWISYERPNERKQEPQSTFVLHLLLKYCPFLKKLKMRECNFEDDFEYDTAKLLPLFTRLDQLVLEKCNVSAELFTFFDVTELILDDVQIHSIGARKRHFRRVNTFKFPIKSVHGPYILSLMDEPTILEHLEMNVCRTAFKLYNKFYCFYNEILKFKNIQTLRMFDLYNSDATKAIDVVKGLTHLSELVWGYPSSFKPADLLQMIRHGKNLQQLVVILRGKTVQPPAPGNEFDSMLRVVSNRTNTKPLNVIFVGTESQITPFCVQFPAEASLKIACLTFQIIKPILNWNSYDQIKMSNEQIEKLRNGGLSL